MPSRMSLRRTKPRANSGPCCSRDISQTHCETNTDDIKIKTEVSRLELNLKKPVRRIFDPVVKNVDNILSSPIKMLEQGFSEKLGQLHSEVVIDSSNILEKLREKLKKPRPLVAKKRIINNILDELFSSMLCDPKSKDVLKEWNSPKKTYEIRAEDKTEFVEVVTDEDNTLHCKPVKPISLQYFNLDAEKEQLPVNDDFRCKVKPKHFDTISDGYKLRTAIDLAVDVYKDNKRKLLREETVPKKKRRLNWCLEITESNSIKNEVEITTADLGEEDLKDFKKENVQEDDNESGLITVEKAMELEMKNNEDCFAETNRDMEYESIQKLQDVVELKKGIIVKDNSPNECNVDSEFKPMVDTFSNEKVKNCSLKRRLIKKRLEKIAEVVTEKNESDLVETEKNIKLKNVSESKEGFIYTDSKTDKRKAVDKFKKDIKKKRKDKDRSSKNKKNDRQKFLRSNKEKELNNVKSKIVDLTVNDNNKKLKLKYQNKHKKKLSIQNEDIKVKFKWKKEQFKLKITEKKEKKRKLRELTPKVFKQYVLKYSPQLTSPKDMIMKPPRDVTHVKRKYIKTEKPEDNLVQTNISSFFKVKPKN